MADQETRTTRRSSMANLGILLIVVGIVILALQYVRIDLNWLPQRWRSCRGRCISSFPDLRCLWWV